MTTEELIAANDALRQRVNELEAENIRRTVHLNRLASWAQQDPTGPWEKIEIQQWVLNEIKGALGQTVDETAWQPAIIALRHRLTAMEAENAALRSLLGNDTPWPAELLFKALVVAESKFRAAGRDFDGWESIQAAAAVAQQRLDTAQRGATGEGNTDLPTSGG